MEMLNRFSPLFSAAEGVGGENVTCPHGVQWILRVFGECVEDQIQMAGFIIGFVSLLLWFLPLIPQLYENYRLQSADGLSVYFLLFWIGGDSTNLIGAILTKQLDIQIYIGVYFILQDLCLLAQFLYYTGRAVVPRVTEDVGSPSQTLAAVMCLGFTGTFLGWKAMLPVGGGDMYQSVAVPGHRSLLNSRPFFHGAMDETGYIIGTISALSYFSGRVPQLIKNHRRGHTDGQSVIMFLIIVLGNLTYGLSVIFAGVGEGWYYMLRHLPWLLGSIGCCFLDFLVIVQVFYFKRRRADSEAEALIE